MDPVAAKLPEIVTAKSVSAPHPKTVDDGLATSQQAKPSGRYQRLDIVDRQSAETLNEFFRVNSPNNEAATSLANRSAWQSFVMSLPLAVADSVSLYLCLVFASALSQWLLGVTTQQVENQTACFAALVIIPIANAAGLYPGLGYGAVMEFRQIFRTIAASLVVFAGIGWFCFPRLFVFYCVCSAIAAVLAVPLVVISRFCSRHLAKIVPWWGARALIVAEPTRGAELYRKMRSKPDQGFRPLGVLLTPDQYWQGSSLLESMGIPAFDIRQTQDVATRHGVTWAIVSPCSKRQVSPSLDPALAAIPNRIKLSSSQLEMGIWDELFCVGTSTGVRIASDRSNSFQLGLKRVMDLILTSFAVVVGAPVLGLFCFLIKLSSRGPIFYGQRRIGRGGNEFTAWKFRTMVANADQVLDRYLKKHPAAMAEWKEKHKLSNDPRVTQIGAFLRKTSLDELPQLWNVLKGEMSLVGPRPIVDSPTYDAEYIHEYPNEYEVYKTVRPGLTGLWQVSSRSNGVYELRVFWDMYYIRNWCIWLDIYLIMRTIKTILLKEGAH